MGRVNYSFLKKSNLTKDVLYDFPEILMEGRRNIRVQNHKGITKFSSEEIMLLIKEGRLRVDGINLEVESFDEEMISIQGTIRKVEFLS